ncbi:MAG: helix-turn-helix transcriptional regulator [Clostridia bacterium]|nr:helix-turn-helix transcriptional regulator [Clostridia bacterium]
MEFKTRLKELRIEKDVSQSDVAKIVNMTKMAISHWEKGNSEPSIEQLKILAQYFDVSVDYLIGYID